MMRVPYRRDELLLAVFSINDEKFSDVASIQDSLGKILNVEQPLLNLQAAEQNGITVVDLINSPNYERLIKVFQESLVAKAVTYLESTGFTNIEAWAVVCIIFGVLDIDLT
jgi:hypothetical protein